MIIKLKTGLTAYELKWAALILMTFDHLAVLFDIIPPLAYFAPLLKLLGRAAAPLFLFVLTESVRYTKSKPRFILRLYFAGVSVGLFTVLTNLLFSRILVYSPNNIVFTYFYTAVFICLLERIIDAVQKRSIKKAFWTILGAAAALLPQLFFYALDRLTPPGTSPGVKILLRDVVTAIFPPILFVEYSLLFVVMGAVLYFLNNRMLQCAVFTCFCALSFLGAAIGGDFWPFNDFFGYRQYWMVLAVPFLFLYNGSRGPSHKAFFYVYYPVHRYLISFFAALLRAG